MGRRTAATPLVLTWLLFTTFGLLGADARAATHNSPAAVEAAAEHRAGISPLPANKNADTHNWSTTNSVVNATASRIVRALGCAVDSSAHEKILHNTLQAWGPKLSALGTDARAINARSSYSSYVRFVVWDYLDGPKGCGTVSSECYRRLYQPLDELLTVLRSKDLGAPVVQARVAALETQINRTVKSLRAHGSRPACSIGDDSVTALAKAAVPPTAPKTPLPPAPPKSTQPEKEVDPPRTPLEAMARVVTDHLPFVPPPLLPAPIVRAVLPSRSRPLPADEAQALPTNLQMLQQALVEAGADPRGVQKALSYYQKNQSRFKNQSYITFIDYTKSALERRLFAINTQTGAVEAFKVAHGRDSGPPAGIPTRFSDKGGSWQSSVGAYNVAEVDNDDQRPERKHRIMLDGLEDSNASARGRGVYMHEAWYVPIGGRSHGCPAMTDHDLKHLQELIGNGSFMYIYSDRV